MKTVFAILLICVWPLFGVAQTIEVTPIDPEGWATEQAFVKSVRNKFLNHIASAKNITIPTSTKAFKWEINWKTQQSYCKNIADALFKSKQRLSFPEPSFSATRDPSSKLSESSRLLHNSKGEHDLQSGSVPKDAAIEFEHAIALESKRQGVPTRMRQGSCDSAYWQRNYFAKNKTGTYSYIEMVNENQIGCLNLPSVHRPTLISGTHKQLIRSHWVDSSIFGFFPNDTGMDDRSEQPLALVGAVDGSPIIFEFGVYTFPFVKLGEMEPARSDWGKPLYGKNGQRYVLIAHPQKNFENTQSLGGFAKTGPLPDKPGNRGFTGWPDPKYGNDTSRYSCFINFDFVTGGSIGR